jgi:hypothetical protein
MSADALNPGPPLRDKSTETLPMGTAFAVMKQTLPAFNRSNRQKRQPSPGQEKRP